MDARADDRQILEPAPQLVGDRQALSRGRLEDHELRRFPVGELAETNRLVSGAPDDELEQSPGVRMRLADQNSGHAHTLGGARMGSARHLV